MLLQSLDPSDTRVEAFRKRVLLEDFGVHSIQDVDSLKYRSEFDRFPEKLREDIYKFSKAKWKSYGFEKIQACIENDSVVSMAGSRAYGKFLRVGMNYYTLRSVRKTHRSLLWTSDGFVNLALQREPRPIGFFITIYSHNSKLTAWTKTLKRAGSLGQLNSTRSVLEGIRRFSVWPTKILVNHVPQTLLYAANSDDFSVEDLIASLESR